MENSLLSFYKRAQRKTAIVIGISGLVFLVITLYLQYREKIVVLSQQANYIEKSIRNDLLSGSKAYVYETCRAHFSDKNIESLTILKGNELYCDFDRGGSSFFFVSAKVPILFNPSDLSSTENIVGYVTLKINAEIVVINLLISASFLAFVVFSFYFAARTLHAAIKQEVVIPLGDFSKIIAANSRDSASILSFQARAKFLEMHTLSSAYMDLTKKLGLAEANLIEESKRATLVDVSRRVAHDIRSPLSVLNILSKRIQPILAEEGILLSEASNRIMRIADDLLDHSRPSSQLNTPPAREENESLQVDSHPGKDLALACHSIIAEKRLLIRSEVRIQCYTEDISTSSYRCDGDELRRILSNLINNATDAIDGSGFITVSISEIDRELIFEIRDSGRGMPKEVIEQVSIKPVSYGKERGNGLGLFPAIQAVRSWGGNVEIESELSRGTKIVVRLVST